MAGRRPSAGEALSRLDDVQLLKGAIFQIEPKTKRNLWQYLALMGFRIPRVAVCEDHQAPFDFIADAFFNRIHAALVLGSRGSGKTRSLALLNLITSKFRPGTITAHIGAVARQSQWGYEYMRDMLSDRLLSEGLAMLPTRDTTMWQNGSQVHITTGSTDTGVTAIRCSRLVLDEIDLWTKDLFEMAQQMVSGDEEHPGQRLMTSTRYTEHGLMNELLPEATERHWEVYQFCLAPESLVATDRGQIRIDRLGSADKVWSVSDKGRVELRPVLIVGQVSERKSILELRLANGGLLRATADHRIRTSQGWVPLGEIKAGDQVYILDNFSIARGGEGQNENLSGMWDRTQGVLEKALPALLGSEACLSNMWWPEGSSVKPVLQVQPQELLEELDSQRERQTPKGQSNEWSFIKRVEKVVGDSCEDGSSETRAGGGWLGAVEQGSSLDRGGEETAQRRTGSGAGRGTMEVSTPVQYRVEGTELVNKDGDSMGARKTLGQISFRSMATGLPSSDRGARGVLAYSPTGSRLRCAEAGYSQGPEHSVAGAAGSRYQVRDSEGAALGLVEVLGVEAAGYSEVWDCAVEGNHNFFANGVLVHNCEFEIAQRCKRCEQHRCPLYSWTNPFNGNVEELCKGRMMKSDGWKPREEVIKDFWSSDTREWAIERLLYAPGVERRVYPTFSRLVHFIAVPEEVLEIPTRIAGVDWGWDNPFAITVWTRTSGGSWHCLDERKERFALPEREDEIVDELREEWGRGLVFFCGKDEPRSIARWQRRGVIAVPATSTRVQAGIKVITRKLVPRPGRGPQLYVSESCPMTAHAFETYHKDRFERIPNQEDDLMDSARYAVESGEELGLGVGGVFRA